MEVLQEVLIILLSRVSTVRSETMSVHTTFLDAIQAIPGETPGEKYCHLSHIVSSAVKNGESVSSLIENQQLPSLLSSYCEVEAARILKNHEAIADALKSEDSLLIKKALSVRSFFDGSDAKITNPDYFSKYLIPHVSLNTRLKIIKTLSHQLVNAPRLAEEFFDLFYRLYGVDQALPLLPACSEEFTYRTVFEKNIVLSRKVVKHMFRKSPNLVFRYIKTVRQKELQNTRKNHKVNLANYSDFIAFLIKRDIESFVEIVGTYENNSLGLNLSKKLMHIFMKKGKKYLIEQPLLFTKMLSFKAIDANTMHTIFPKLLPENQTSFQIDSMLSILEYYPKEDRLSLLKKSYFEKYCQNLQDNCNNLTPNLLLLLPAEERVQIAKVQQAKSDRSEPLFKKTKSGRLFEHTWRCYYVACEVIPIIKEDIAKTSEIERRCELMGEIIYCCKVNGDENSFLDFLKYFKDRHKNETAQVFSNLLDTINILFDDLCSFSTETWSVLDGLIKIMYVKGYMNVDYDYSLPVLEGSVHHKILHNLPMNEILELIAQCNLESHNEHWNILVENPLYEEQCLTAFIALVIQKLEDPSSCNKSWIAGKNSILSGLLDAIHNYNVRHEKAFKHLNKKKLSVSNYPKLMRAIIDLLMSEKNEKDWLVINMKKTLKLHDKILFEAHFKTIADVQSGEALSLLKQDPKSILNNWELYLHECQHWRTNNNVIRFIKTVRWHNIIPIKWREECEKNLNESSYYLGVLGVLLDGPSFEKLVNPFMPKQKTLEVDGNNAKESYQLTSLIPSACNFVNPPPSLDILNLYFEGDYLNDGLRASRNLCRRTTASKVISFSNVLTSQRVSVKKHAIRLYCLVATIDQSCQLLTSQWATEKHHSIRELLFQNVHDLFLKHQTPETWLLLNSYYRTLSLDDLSSFILRFNSLFNLKEVPNEYVAEYIKNVLAAIEKSIDCSFDLPRTNECITSLLNAIDSSICDVLSDCYIMDLIKEYLFHPYTRISKATIRLALDSYILPHELKRDQRLNSFIEMLTDAIRRNWDQPYSEKMHYRPVNQALYHFVDRMCLSSTKKTIAPTVAVSMLRIFETTLEPRMDARSYLLLTYTKQLLLSKSVTDFGTRIGGEVENLVKIFSELLMNLMIDTMVDFLNSNSSLRSQFFNSNEINYMVPFIEGLLQSKNVHSYFMAANLLNGLDCHSLFVENKDFVNLLLNCGNLAVYCIVRNKMNSITLYCNCASKKGIQGMDPRQPHNAVKTAQWGR